MSKQKSKPCYTCKVADHCVNGDIDRYNSRYDYDAAGDMGYHKIPCSKCGYHTGKCEDCFWQNTEICPEYKEEQ